MSVWSCTPPTPPTALRQLDLDVAAYSFGESHVALRKRAGWSALSRAVRLCVSHTVAAPGLAIRAHRQKAVRVAIMSWSRARAANRVARQVDQRVCRIWDRVAPSWCQRLLRSTIRHWCAAAAGVGLRRAADQHCRRAWLLAPWRLLGSHASGMRAAAAHSAAIRAQVLTRAWRCWWLRVQSVAWCGRVAAAKDSSTVGDALLVWRGLALYGHVRRQLEQQARKRAQAAALEGWRAWVRGVERVATLEAAKSRVVARSASRSTRRAALAQWVEGLVPRRMVTRGDAWARGCRQQVALSTWRVFCASEFGHTLELVRAVCWMRQRLSMCALLWWAQAATEVTRLQAAVEAQRSRYRALRWGWRAMARLTARRSLQVLCARGSDRNVQLAMLRVWVHAVRRARRVHLGPRRRGMRQWVSEAQARARLAPEACIRHILLRRIAQAWRRRLPRLRFTQRLDQEAAIALRSREEASLAVACGAWRLRVMRGARLRSLRQQADSRSLYQQLRCACSAWADEAHGWVEGKAQQRRAAAVAARRRQRGAMRRWRPWAAAAAAVEHTATATARRLERGRRARAWREWRRRAAWTARQRLCLAQASRVVDAFVCALAGDAMAAWRSQMLGALSCEESAASFEAWSRRHRQRLGVLVWRTFGARRLGQALALVRAVCWLGQKLAKRALRRWAEVAIWGSLAARETTCLRRDAQAAAFSVWRAATRATATATAAALDAHTRARHFSFSCWRLVAHTRGLLARASARWADVVVRRVWASLRQQRALALERAAVKRCADAARVRSILRAWRACALPSTNLRCFMRAPPLLPQLRCRLGRWRARVLASKKVEEARTGAYERRLAVLAGRWVEASRLAAAVRGLRLRGCALARKVAMVRWREAREREGRVGKARRQAQNGLLASRIRRWAALARLARAVSGLRARGHFLACKASMVRWRDAREGGECRMRIHRARLALCASLLRRVQRRLSFLQGAAWLRRGRAAALVAHRLLNALKAWGQRLREQLTRQADASRLLAVHHLFALLVRLHWARLLTSARRHSAAWVCFRQVCPPPSRSPPQACLTAALCAAVAPTCSPPPVLRALPSSFQISLRMVVPDLPSVVRFDMLK